MPSLLLLSALVACAPVTDLDTSPSESEDTGDKPDPNENLDGMVNSWFPEDYAPENLARVVFVGDSITAGDGASKAKLAYTKLLEDNPDDTWPTGEELDLDALYDESPEIIDESLPGATTASLVSKQLPHVTEALGDQVSGVTAVIVTIGGNDVQTLIARPNDTEETTEGILENLGEFYDYFQDAERFPDGSVIYLANVYEPSDGVGQVDGCFGGLNLESVLGSLDYVNAATLEHAKERNVAWIDMHGHFLGHGFYAEDEDNDYYEENDPTEWFDSDCIHPNDRGHHEIRRLMWYGLAGLPFPGDEPVSAE